MFKSYLTIAWKVLLRRKVFSFISLFGITITLAILLVVSTFVDNYLNPAGPEKNSQNFLTISRLTLESEDKKNTWSSSPGYKFLHDNVLRLKAPEKISIFSRNEESTSFINGDKISNQLKRTDVNYWEILDYTFIAGRAFNQAELDAGSMVVVITETTKKEFFGDEKAIGEPLKVNNQKFKVIGIVEDIFALERNAYADMWVPYTTSPSTLYKESMAGNWSAILYHSNKELLADVQKEYINLLQEDFASADPERFNAAYSTAETALDRIARPLANSKKYENGTGQLLTLMVLIVIAFMLLPSINLINLNVSRIMERSSEIGVRKTFGASSTQLVIQFVVENILVTMVGGLIGFLLSWLILNQIETSEIIPGANFHYSLRTFFYGFGLTVVFGLLSGAYPAYKMSRLNPVSALKGSI